MEFGEKLQLLRKKEGITQEALAEVLYVSRTAVSKWESGRGYPNIESLKDISEFFSVSIDDLLSADKLIFIAEKENKESIRGLCDIMSGAADIFSLLPVILPLYPNEVQGFVYSVSLIDYSQVSSLNLTAYWLLYLLLFVAGIIKLVFTLKKAEKAGEVVTALSVVLNAVTVIFLALTREAYAAVVVFLLLVVKTLIILRRLKSK